MFIVDICLWEMESLEVCIDDCVVKVPGDNLLGAGGTGAGGMGTGADMTLLGLFGGFLPSVLCSGGKLKLSGLKGWMNVYNYSKI